MTKKHPLSDEQEKLAETNYTIALFIATLLKEKAEFDRVNTLAGFLKEHFCSSLAIGSEWPKPVSRGQTRPGLERDIMLVKDWVFFGLGQKYII